MIRATQRRGTVLLIVVVIVMLLSLVAYKFLLSMETEHMAAAVLGDRLQAQQSAFSARDLFVMILKKPRAERDAMGGLRDNPSYFAGDMTALNDLTSSTTSLNSELVKQPPFGLVAYALPILDDEELAGENSSRSRLAAGDTMLLVPPTRYGAINESSKLHLWKVLGWETENPGAGVDALMSLPGMDEETAEALLDWLDPDDDPRASGAESEFYATLTRPIAPRNGLPVDIDELLFVKGITAIRLFGTQTEVPSTPSFGALRGSETRLMPSQNQSSSRGFERSQSTDGNADTFLDTKEPIRPWIDYLTIHAAERNESYTGEPRIFLNHGNLQELHAALSGVTPKAWADYIVLYRQFGRSDIPTSKSQQSNDTPVTIDFQIQAEFRIESVLDLVETAVSIPDPDNDEEHRSVASPLDADTLAIRPETTEVLDLLTIVPGNRIIGRINVNEATAEVLATLPGLSTDTIESIIAARQTGDKEIVSRVHPLWLLTEGLVSLETMRQLLPHVTCGGDVYRAEVWGRAEEQNPMVHFETVLDAATKVCRPVFYRELDSPKHQIKILSSEEFSSLGITTPNETSNRSY